MNPRACCVCRRSFTPKRFPTEVECPDCRAVYRICFSGVDHAVRLELPRCNSVPDLQRALDFERARPLPRTTLIKGIERRLRKLTAEAPAPGGAR